MPTMTPDSPFEAFPQLDSGTHCGAITQLLVSTRDGGSLLSAGETTIRVWDLVPQPAERAADPAERASGPGRRLKRLLLGRVNGPTDDGAIDGRVSRNAVSRDGRWLVALKPWRHTSLLETAHDGGRVTEVQVFEIATGNLQSRFVHPGPLLDLDFSPDGRWLALVGFAKVGRRRQVEVQVIATAELLRRGARPPPPVQARLALGRSSRVADMVASLRFVPVAAGAPRAAPRVPQRLVVAIDAPGSGQGELAWLRWSPPAGLVLERNLATDLPIETPTLAVSATMVAVAAWPPPSRKRRGRLLWVRHDVALAADSEGGVGVIDTEAPPGSAAFSPSGHRLAVGQRVDLHGNHDELPGLQTVQVAVYEITPYKPPLLRSSFFGHDGNVLAVCFVDDDTIASAGGDNHAIHFWRHAHRVAQADEVIRGVGRVAIEPGITSDERVLFGTVPLRLLPPGHAMRQQSFDLRRMVLSTTAASDLRKTDFASRKWWVGYPSDMVIPLWFIGDDDGSKGDPTAFAPDLNLFVGADDSWVIWSRSGYYHYGGGDAAARRIGYRINRGLGQEALLIPSDRFKFYRQDIIEKIVLHGTEERAIARGVPIPKVDVSCILPPIIELAPGGIRKEGHRVRLSFTVESPCRDELPTRTSLLRNGRVVWMDAKPPQRRRARCAVPALPLLPGRNRFAFHAENAQAKSMPVEFEIEGPERAASDAPEAGDKPGWLYLLAVGVGEFADKGTEALKLPAHDAKAVYDAFGHGRMVAGRSRRGHAQGEAARNQAFEYVDAKLLVDAQATKAAILAELGRMCDSIHERHASAGAERDVLFVFLSGHGVRVSEKGGAPTLFFQNHDMVKTAEAVDATGLSMLDLGDRITSVPAEVVLVVDACHAALSGRGTMGGLDAEELARRVHAIHERGMYVVSASRADEFAIEDDAVRSGLLTASLLRALAHTRQKSRAAGAGGRRNIDVLMAELLASVQRVVPELAARAGESQTPVCRIYGDLTPLTIYRN